MRQTERKRQKVLLWRCDVSRGFYSTSRKTNSDGKKKRAEQTSISSLPRWEGRRAHARGLLPWQSVLCRPDGYKLEFAGRFDVKFHPRLVFVAKLCHPGSPGDLCSQIKRTKMLSCLLLRVSWLCSVRCSVCSQYTHTHTNLGCWQDFWICADTIYLL